MARVGEQGDLPALVAANISRLRVRMRMSQRELAELCGLSRRTIIRIEQEATDLPLSTVAKLAAGLGVEPCRLLEADALAVRRR